LARLAKQRGEAELAEQYWRRSLQRKPHGTQALEALAWHYYDAGRLEEAETLFRRATQVPAGSLEIPRHTAYAVFLYSQKRYAEARAQMEEALRRNPRDGHARKLQELLDQP
jgi:Tfp pilus assembly protein PilF